MKNRYIYFFVFDEKAMKVTRLRAFTMRMSVFFNYNTLSAQAGSLNPNHKHRRGGCTLASGRDGVHCFNH
jgi:hypothetical protein